MSDKLINFLKEGTISFPKLLFRHYKQLGISDVQFLLFLHLHVFAEENNTFPTIVEIEQRMDLTAAQIITQFQYLIKNDFLTIEEDYDQWGKITEFYNLTPLYKKMLPFIFPKLQEEDKKSTKHDNNLFKSFENEFGRPITPIEYESICQWLDQDHYSEELILAALNEAVISGILNFRYIDRILLEWARNNIKTEAEAKRFSARFREKQFERKQKQQKEVKAISETEEVRFPQFNWLESKQN